jgi:hypothetical protein
MASLQEQVNDICKLADKVVENPSCAIDEVAKKINVSPSIVAFVAGAVLVPGPLIINGAIAAIWKLFRDSKRQRQEKERMLREVVCKQQAIIRKLESENVNNKKEIDNLKHILKMLNEVETAINAA